jgi:IclR family pca regulon transcriptional regulator
LLVASGTAEPPPGTAHHILVAAKGKQRGMKDERLADIDVHSAQRKYFIESLARGLAVLSAFDPTHTELSLAEIAKVANVSRPSALRIGYTLTRLGYLMRNSATHGYRIGPKALSLGMATLSSMSLVDTAEPFLRDLRDATRENIKMAVLQGSEIVYVSRFASQLEVNISIYVGTRLPAAITSIGRVILAFLPEDVALDVVERSGLTAETTPSITTLEGVMSELRLIRDRGYTINDQGLMREIRSAAAPIIDAAGHPVAGINVTVSSQRITAADLEERLVPLLVATARSISRLLPPDPQHPLTAHSD